MQREAHGSRSWSATCLEMSLTFLCYTRGNGPATSGKHSNFEKSMLEMLGEACSAKRIGEPRGARETLSVCGCRGFLFANSCAVRLGIHGIRHMIQSIIMHSVRARAAGGRRRGSAPWVALARCARTAGACRAIAQRKAYPQVTRCTGQASARKVTRSAVRLGRRHADGTHIYRGGIPPQPPTGGLLREHPQHCPDPDQSTAAHIWRLLAVAQRVQVCSEAKVGERSAILLLLLQRAE